MNRWLRRVRLRPALAAPLALVLAAGCAGAAPAGAPVADPEAAAAELQRITALDGPRQVTFAWTLDEAGSRLRGRGVARLIAPDRIRLDLFGPRGETYLSAALVEGEFRLPGGVPGAVPLPSPALLWAAVGVVRPPAEAALAGATATERDLVVRYQADGETWEYRAAGEPLRLNGVSRSERGGVVETLAIAHGAEGELRSTRYRDLAAYRELVLDVESIEVVAPFPPGIWRPDGTAR